VRRSLLIVALLVGLTPIDEVRAQPASPPPRPNIIFVLADDHAAHAVSAYDPALVQTPNIDRLADEGMRFDRAFVTNAICAPCRAVLLTGKHSHVNGVLTNAERFDGSQTTFPKLLQVAGYQTALIGKWHLKSEPTGFDHYEVLRGQGPYYNPPLKSPEGIVEHTGYTTDVITDRALSWLREGREQDKPFLLLYWHKAPHRNWQPGPRHLTRFDDRTIPEPATLFDDYRDRASGAATQEMTIERHLSPFDLKLEPPKNLTPAQLAAWNAAYEPKNEAFRQADLTGAELVRWMYQRYLKDYLRTIVSIDENLGRVLAYLDEAGLSDDTIVVYSSDQGFFLGEHGWYDKRWMYEECLQVPLLVRWPGRVPAGESCGQLVQNLDLAPTFLALAGVEVPSDMQGRSLEPLLRGQTPADWRRSIYYRYYEFPGVHAVPRHYGVRTDRYKLIHYEQLDEWELFDLRSDPYELHSIHASPEHRAVVEDLQRELIRLREHYGDAEPTQND
jgi:arylsulfatase A-like enzyme